jgi:hypothetical protein
MNRSRYYQLNMIEQTHQFVPMLTYHSDLHHLSLKFLHKLFIEKPQLKYPKIQRPMVTITVKWKLPTVGIVVYYIL